MENKEKQIYTLAIIGSGPAGLSAALTAKQRNLDFIWFGNDSLSEKVTKAPVIHNYPGLIAVTGQEMYEQFYKQIKAEEIELTNEVINQVFKMGENYALFAGQKSWQAKYILIATGSEASNTIKGEKELLGKGVSYCATCDGRLYKDRTIAVIINSKSLIGELDFLAGIAGKIYVFSNKEIMAEIKKKVAAEKLVCAGIAIKSVEGQDMIEAVVATDGTNYKVDGLFCLREGYAISNLIPVELENNHIKVDRKQASSLTNVYAAGDCTGAPFQYAKAIGEANVAIHTIVEMENKKND